MRVLFVDDDPHILASLRRMSMSECEIQTVFAGKGEEALKMMAESDFDIVVVDMRMPGMDGATLLENVHKSYPGVIRLVLSGHSDRNIVNRSAKLAHQYISKPCPFDEIKEVLKKVYGLRSILPDKKNRDLVCGIGMLPVLDSIYRRLVEELEHEDFSLETAGEIVEQDAGLTAGILKVVNSSFYGIPQPVTTPVKAVSNLGSELLRSLVLDEGLFSVMDPSKLPGISLHLLWSHSLSTAQCCRGMAEKSAGLIDPDEAFNAGLIHDVGKLVLADSLPNEYAVILEALRDTNRSLAELEHEVFGANHAQIGAYLLGLWGFSECTVKAVAEHHGAGGDPENVSPLACLLHAADVLEHEFVTIHEDYKKPVVDGALFEKSGISEELFEEWRSICFRQLMDTVDE